MLIKKLIILMMILWRILEICLILMLIKKINDTNDEDFIENIRDLFNNKLDKKLLIIIIIIIMNLERILEIYLVY